MEGTATIIKEVSVSVKEQAKEKISREISEYDNTARENGIACIMPEEERRGLEEFLFECVENEDGFAENVLKEEKSIKKGLQWAGRKIPEKMKQYGMVPIDNRTVFEWFAEYFAVDEAKEKAEAEAKRKLEEAKRKANMTEDQKKAAEEAKKRMAEAEAAAKKKAEEEKRKKLGVCEGQMDLFSMMPGIEPNPTPTVSEVVSNPTPDVPVNDAPIDRADEETEESEFYADIDAEDLAKLPFDVTLDGLIPKESSEDPEDEDEDDFDPLPWEEGDDDV